MNLTTYWRTEEPWKLSTYLHGLMLVTVSMIALWPEAEIEYVNFDVFEVPKLATKTLSLTQPKPLVKKKAEKKRAVFGASKRARTADRGETVKLGNTIAKKQDKKKLRADDAESLPIPTEEYLITAMPKILNEFRIPYPVQAKRKGIQGAVVLNLLIDPAGRVRAADLVSGPGYGLNKAALAAVMRFRFKPAQVERKPVAVRIRYIYRFVLE